MELSELITVLVNAFLFFIVYKLGQFSILIKLDKHQHLKKIEQHSTAIISRPIITIEEINGNFYAYDGDDFLAQGASADELGKHIAQRYPSKYQSAKIQMKV